MSGIEFAEGDKQVEAIELTTNEPKIERERVVCFVFDTDEHAQQFIREGRFPVGCRRVQLGIPYTMLLTEDQVRMLLSPAYLVKP
jgi:hypothetical protein